MGDRYEGIRAIASRPVDGAKGWAARLRVEDGVRRRRSRRSAHDGTASRAPQGPRVLQRSGETAASAAALARSLVPVSARPAVETASAGALNRSSNWAARTLDRS